MRNSRWLRLLAYVTGSVNQELLLRNEYLAAENRILRTKLPTRLRLSNPERITLAELGKRLGRKALREVACVAKPDTILGWYRRLVAHKFDGSKHRQYPGRPPVSPEVEALVVRMTREETRPMYLHLTQERFLQLDAGLYAGSPPLRDKQDQDALWAGIAKGTIHTVGTDHGARSRVEKLDPSPQCNHKTGPQCATREIQDSPVSRIYQERKGPGRNLSWPRGARTGNVLHASAPPAWRAWVEKRAYQPLVAEPTIEYRTKEEQQPGAGRDQSLVRCVYDYFKDNPYGFEHCAARLAELMDPNINIEMVTRPSVDGGRDAIGNYRVGPLADRISLNFALEAKCYAPENGVGVKELSRLISRLRHREFGILVTTSYLSQQAYQELRSDRHPVVVMAGVDIAAVLVKAGLGTPETVKQWLTAEFPGKPAEGFLEAT